MTTDPLSRVDLTGEAAELLRRLTAENGPLMFHQSGGCCDGSAPMCYPDGDFIISDADVHLGDLDIALDRPVPVYMSKSQFEYWKHTHLTIDVTPGRGAGFSIERLTYTNATLFPPMALARTLQRRRGLSSEEHADQEIRVPAAPVNLLLTGVLRLESWWLRVFDAPFGSSLLCLARKPASPGTRTS